MAISFQIRLLLKLKWRVPSTGEIEIPVSSCTGQKVPEKIFLFSNINRAKLELGGRHFLLPSLLMGS